MCSSHKVHSALIEEHGIMKAFIHTPSMKPTVVVFWLGLEPQRGAIVPGSLMIKYAGSCQNNSRYLKTATLGHWQILCCIRNWKARAGRG